MKILVTGGAGFIGSNFCRYVIEKYPMDEVVCLDALTYAGNLENLNDIIGNEKFNFIKGNICDEELVDNLFNKERFDVVVNFAAESDVDRSIINSKEFLMSNIIGVQTLMDACVKYNVKKFHQISTDEVYGELPLNDKGDLFYEYSPLKATNPYSVSKASADLLALSYHRIYKLPVTISRCSNNYGPYQFPEKLIPLTITKIFSDEAWTNLPADFSNTASTGDNSLKSRRIKLIRKNSVKEARVENKLEPDGFPRLREKLETWVNNVLEVQSIQRSREELVKSSEHNEEIGDEKWGRRDVEYRNLSDAISYYTLAKMDLTSLGASSKDIDRIQKKIDEAEIELKKRYDLVRSEATRLRKIGDWEKAREEFAKIRELIPRRDDERHRDAENNLEIIEKHIWEIDGKGKRK